MRSCIPNGPVILTHNDTQENNILLSLGSAKPTICLIDYEYGMWNPQMYDVANYLNEWVCDNAYPAGSGIMHFIENFPSEEEITNTTRLYYLLEHGETAVWSMEDPACQQKVLAVKQCMVLNAYYWSMWSIMVLTTADETDPEAFHWDLINGKCDLYLEYAARFGFDEL